MVTISTQSAGPASEHQRRRDSFFFGYEPGEKLLVDESVRFHVGREVELDPISYEVIRSKLWNLNLDHGETIRRTSGSFIVVDANDFNVSILTETGEPTAFGPYNWFFAGYADLVVRWTLEHRSANPGIRDADVFIQNDPWVGTNHQNDTTIYSPVFWDGELFAWIYNCVHQRDVGGAVPGSINPGATSVYDEATFFPPVKLVEGGYLREDILDCWTRRSRMADLNTLEVKAQLAGINFARRRLCDIIDRYGPDAVKGAMNKTLDDTSATVAERLRELPDAIWRDMRYLSGAGNGDFRPYKLCLSYTKRGDRLCVSNAGTDPAVGMLNFTFGALRGSVVTGLLHAFGYDLDMCGGGVLRQLDFEIEHGTISAATHPSSIGASVAMIGSCNQAQTLASKMVSGHPDLRVHGFASSALHTVSGGGFWGLDQYGKPYGNSILDTVSGGSGAFAVRDGIDHTGSAIGVNTPISDVETFERGVPLLCMFRRELPESGGHGRFRGGAAITSVWIGEGSTDNTFMRGGLLASMTLGRGVDGAPVASAGRNRLASSSEARDWLREGRVPAEPDDLRQLAPTLASVGPAPQPFTEESVLEIVSNSGVGYGDPVERDPAAVLTDVRHDRVAAADVERVYGVVVEDDEIDLPATNALRAGILADRLTTSAPPSQPMSGRSVSDPVHCQPMANVHVGGSEGDTLICGHCGQHLAPLGWQLPTRVPTTRGESVVAVAAVRRPHSDGRRGDRPAQLPVPVVRHRVGRRSVPGDR